MNTARESAEFGPVGGTHLHSSSTQTPSASMATAGPKDDVHDKQAEHGEALQCIASTSSSMGSTQLRTQLGLQALV
jgi:hypothetical protein